jgi:hypothetical protein
LWDVLVLPGIARVPIEVDEHNVVALEEVHDLAGLLVVVECLTGLCA